MYVLHSFTSPWNEEVDCVNFHPNSPCACADFPAASRGDRSWVADWSFFHIIWLCAGKSGHKGREEGSKLKLSKFSEKGNWLNTYLSRRSSAPKEAPFNFNVSHTFIGCIAFDPVLSIATRHHEAFTLASITDVYPQSEYPPTVSTANLCRPSTTDQY